MNLFLTILDHGGAIFLLVAIFGVSMASLVTKWEERERKRLTAGSPLDMAWWQDLQELGFEVHLVNGDTWRSAGRFEPTIWRSMVGTQAFEPADAEFSEQLTEYMRAIKNGKADDKHAHQLADWSKLDRAYQLKLLNGSEWQFNLKSEGLDGGNSLAWHKMYAPEHLVFESIERVHDALDLHLDLIRKRERTSAGLQAWVDRPAVPGLADANLRSGAQVSNTCGSCGIVPVSIPGGICQWCREAQAPNA